MLHVLPVELSLAILSYLPIQTLCPLPSLSHKWFDFFSQNQSTIFRNAAVLHGYTHPETYLLEDALSDHKGSPWEGTTDWKDFCRLSIFLFGALSMYCTVIPAPDLSSALLMTRRAYGLSSWY
jgi:hypothetical protein